MSKRAAAKLLGPSKIKKTRLSENKALSDLLETAKGQTEGIRALLLEEGLDADAAGRDDEEDPEDDKEEDHEEEYYGGDEDNPAQEVRGAERYGFVL